MRVRFVVATLTLTSTNALRSTPLAAPRRRPLTTRLPVTASDQASISSLPVRAMSQPLAETVNAIKSIWDLPITNEYLTPSPGAATPFGGVSMVSSESTVTTLWNRDIWNQHKSRARWWKTFVNFPNSTILRGMIPLLGVIAAWTWVSWLAKWQITGAAVGYIAAPLGLMLAFRVNSVVGRFHEGRSLWGATINDTRNIASLVSSAGNGPEDDMLKARCCRLLVCYAWAVKAAGRYENPTVAPVLKALLGKEEAERASACRKPAVHCLSLLRKSTMELSRTLPLACSNELQRAISNLNHYFGGMERLMSTPLSPTYMRHSSRGLLLMLGLLPAGLMGAGVTSLPKLLMAVLATSYVMIGIDEIGIQIEMPFDILPLHGMATVITKDVEDELTNKF